MLVPIALNGISAAIVVKLAASGLELLMTPLVYLQHYPLPLQQQVQELLQQRRLGEWLLQRYPQIHSYNSAKALYDYCLALKNTYLRQSKPLTKVVFDDQIQDLHNALGLQGNIRQVQGQKVKVKHEIRIASLFRRVPEEFLKMIVVHELAHLREREHNKAFYQLCEHMEPNYHQYELHLRLYLTQLALAGPLY